MQAEILIVDGEVRAPSEKRYTRKCDASPRADQGDKRRDPQKPRNRHDLRARAPRRLFNSKQRNAWKNSGKGDDEEGNLPAVARPEDAAENMAASAPEQHAGCENGLGNSAALLRKRARNHGLRRGSISSFTKADHGARDQEKNETGSQTARKSRHAPEQNAHSDDGLAAEPISEKSKRDAGHGENNQQESLQRAELRVRHLQVAAQQRNQRHKDLPRREVDKIDQSKYSKKTNLIRRERNGLRRHSEFAW